MPLSLALLIFVCAVLATGCATSSRLAEKKSLARHPVQEARMSSRPENGFSPSGVWRIRGAQNTVYLAGTFHVVADDQIPLPSPFYAAYQDSAEVYVELDADPSLLAKVGLVFKARKWVEAHQAEFFYAKGQALADYLPASTIERLREHYGRDYSRRERMTPLFLLFLNEAEAACQPDGKNTGVEDVFTLLARKDGKPVHSLDDSSIVDTALTMLDEMLLNLGLEIARRGADTVIRENILNAEKESEDDQVWRRGDLARVTQMHAQMKRESPSLYEKALPERNQKWMPKLKAALKSKRNVMVLVGIAHLGGEDGLLRLLQEAGFSAEQMYGVDRPRPNGPKND